MPRILPRANSGEFVRSKMFQQQLMNRLVPYFDEPKIAEMRKHVPEIRKQTLSSFTLNNATILQLGFGTHWLFAKIPSSKNWRTNLFKQKRGMSWKHGISRSLIRSFNHRRSPRRISRHCFSHLLEIKMQPSLFTMSIEVKVNASPQQLSLLWSMRQPSISKWVF